MTSPAALEQWERQLREVVAPFVAVALDGGHAVQVVLYLDGRTGRAGEPKITVNARSIGVEKPIALDTAAEARIH